MYPISLVRLEADWSMWMWVLILAIAMIPIVFSSKRRCAWRSRFTTVALFAVLIAMGGAMAYYLTVKRPNLPDFKGAYTGENGEIKPTDHVKAVHPTASDPSLEALWDKLTKSRISLEGDETAPADDSAPADDANPFQQERGTPDWVTTPPKQVGPVYRDAVASDPFVTEAECRRQLERELLPQAVAQRMSQLVGHRLGHEETVGDPLSMGIGLDYIFREICRDQYTAIVDSSVGEMKKVHVLLEFDEESDAHLLETWLRWERQKRFASFSKIAALSLTGLAAIYGLLRFDTWSRGYYSRQLLFGSVLAIIALAVFVLRT